LDQLSEAPLSSAAPFAFFAVRAMAAAGALAGLLIADCASPPAPKPPPTWDGLELVERVGLDSVYLRPGASLAAYKRVTLRHAEVSLDSNWMPFKDPVMQSRRVDPNRIVAAVADAFDEVLARELQQHSYDVVASPDHDVLRVVPAISDLFVKFVDSDALMLDTGHMVLVLELRDSMTNAALARVVDRAEARATDLPVGSAGLKGSAAAERILTEWAVTLRTALDRAHAQPPAADGRR
jgi:hypothetical protein